MEVKIVFWYVSEGKMINPTSYVKGRRIEHLSITVSYNNLKKLWWKNINIFLKSDKVKNKFRLVALKIIVVQKQFTQIFLLCYIKYECLSKPASEAALA